MTSESSDAMSCCDTEGHRSSTTHDDFVDHFRMHSCPHFAPRFADPSLDEEHLRAETSLTNSLRTVLMCS
jgi:hypothetical protein